MDTNPQKLIANLRSFNSKERYYLIEQVLGVQYFSPEAGFLESIEQELKLSIPPLDFPAGAFCAMDYHLDWLYASLCLSAKSNPILFNNPLKYSHDSKRKRLIQGNQEDIDFIITYCTDNECHLIFIEAKGVTGWDNKQMASKAARLKAIFGDEGDKWKGVVPHFILLSPSKLSDRFNTKDFPKWMKPDGTIPWNFLRVDNCLQLVSRCDDTENLNENGDKWIKRPRKYHIDKD